MCCESQAAATYLTTLISPCQDDTNKKEIVNRLPMPPATPTIRFVAPVADFSGGLLSPRRA